MQVIDPGHKHRLQVFDSEILGGEWHNLQFVKRNDPPEKYPGNEDAYPGTIIQEVLRALIDRGEYVNGQLPCHQTEEFTALMAQALWLLEQRHAELHGHPDDMNIYDLVGIDLQDFCTGCGHILCFCGLQ